MNTLAITLSPHRTAWILGSISVVLCAVSIAGKALEWALGVHSTYFIYQTVLTFNVNRESNIPTWYSTLLLLTCAVLLGIIALAQQQSGKAGARHWKGLALIFLYLSLDETAVIHEKLTIPLQESLHVTGFLYFGWVLAGAAVVVAVGLIYARFIFRLPPPTRRLFILAALLYVGGALVVEAISANQWYQTDSESLLFSAIGTIEELGEMLGTVVFIYALSSYIRDYVGEFRIGITPTHPLS